MQRCMLLFNEAINSLYTKQNYIQHLDKFKKHVNVKTYYGLFAISLSKLQVNVAFVLKVHDEEIKAEHVK